MTDFYFALELISVTLASVATYALLMSLLQKEVNARWVKGELILVLVAVLCGLYAGATGLMQGTLSLKISFVVLLLTLCSTIGMLLVSPGLRFDARRYSEASKKRLLALPVLTFGLLVTQLLLLFYSVGGM